MLQSSFQLHLQSTRLIMKTIKLGLALMLTVSFMTSCTDLFQGSILEVELPEHQSKLAPYAFFKDSDSVLVVKVGKSVGVLDTINPDNVLNATVELFKNGNLEYTFIYNTTTNAYEYDLGAPFSPVEGDVYELRVSKEGFETATALQTVPSRVPIDTVVYNQGGGVNQFGEQINIINLTFTDPAGVSNYYEFGGYVDIKYTDPFDTTFVYEYQNTLYLESNDPNYDNGIMFDANFDGLQYTIRLEDNDYFGWGNSDNTEITGVVRLTSSTYDYATFTKSLNDYWDADGNPFAEPVILYSNMSTNLGLFGILVASEYELK